MPEELGGEDDGMGTLPGGAVGGQFEIGQEQQRRGAQRVDQGRVVQVQAQVAGAQVGISPRDVVLLVHSRGLQEGTGYR